MKKKILILGNSANAYALAKKLSENHDVYVAPGSDTIKNFATCVDIRETSSAKLLEFALETGIDLTIPVSQHSIYTDLTDLFNNNNQPVFAPSYKAVSGVLDKAGIKKILYKLRIPTPKFGIFEKQNMAYDYIKNIKTPFVIKTNDPSSAVIFTSPNSAKNTIDSIFANKNAKVIIEDYVYGTPFTFYAITDGYKAIQIGSSLTYKHSLEGDGGQLTSGMGACVPNYKLTADNEYFIINNVVYPILEYVEAGGNPYIGIIGINGVLSENGSIQILGIHNFMQDCDCAPILNLVDTDLYSLFEACILGTFSDDIEDIPIIDKASSSLVLNCQIRNNTENIIKGLENLDESTHIAFYGNVKKNKYLEYEAEFGPVLMLTTTGRTISSAVSKMYSEVDCINFEGLYYRKDICKANISTF